MPEKPPPPPPIPRYCKDCQHLIRKTGISRCAVGAPETVRDPVDGPYLVRPSCVSKNLNLDCRDYQEKVPRIWVGPLIWMCVIVGWMIGVVVIALWKPW